MGNISLVALINYSVGSLKDSFLFGAECWRCLCNF